MTMQGLLITENINDLQVCLSCKQRKRKCDKVLPTCTSCNLKGLSCKYPPIASRYVEYNPEVVKETFDTDSIQYDVLLGAKASDGLDDPSVLESRHTFLTRLFLDRSVVRYFESHASDADTVVPYSVRKHLAGLNIRATCERYFSTIHRWLPILSKKRIHQEIPLPPSRTREDRVLLYMCMELATQSSINFSTNPRSSLYLAAKTLHTSMETRGFFTLEVLQAAMLIAVYEIGHAIYPSAYLSVGACARYATALGVNEKIKARMTWPLTRLEVEEERRVWWAVLILDRFVNLSNPARVLSTEDPHPSDLLPVDDSAWDTSDVSTAGFYNLSAPSTLSMGRFARLAQAAYLLGRVFKHTTSPIPSSDPRFHDAEALQLHATIRALIALTEVEGEIRQLEFCNQTALCYSSLLLLDPSATQTAPAGRYVIQKDGAAFITIRQEVCRATADIWGIFLGRMSLQSLLQKISPLALHVIYSAAVICARQVRQGKEMEEAEAEAEKAAIVLRRALVVLAGRWRAAGAYLELLDIRDEMKWV